MKKTGIFLTLLMVAFLTQAQITVRDIQLSGLTIQGSSEVAAPDWSNDSNLIAWFDMDAASGGEAAVSGTCSTCDLTAGGTNSPGSDTTNKVEGTGSRTVVTSGQTSYFTCDWDSVGSCDEFDFSNEDFSWVFSTRMGANPTGDKVIIGKIDNTDNGGYTIGINQNTPDDWRALYRDSGGTNRNLSLSQTGDILANEWYHVTYTYDTAPTPTHKFYARNGDGVAASSYDISNSETEANPINTVGATTDVDFYMAWSDVATNNQASSNDEFSVWDIVLSEDASCRLCACGVDGSRCTVSGGSYVNTGNWDTVCAKCGSVGTAPPCPTATTAGSC